METLAIIQARGGSKSIPKKNIYLLAGKPLIAWTIEAAQASKRVTRVIVSTDDNEIADVARLFGAEVPFMRPTEFATDDAKSVGLLKHALDWLSENEGYEPDLVVQLKPTNPLRTAQSIDACVDEFLSEPGYDSLITVNKSPVHPLKTWKFEGHRVLPFIPENVFGIKEASKMPRQLLPEVVVQNSGVNVILPATIFTKQSSIGTKIRGHVLSREESVNIDVMLDFHIAEFLMQKRAEGLV